MSFADSFRAARWVRTLNLVLQAFLILTLVGGLNYVSLYYAWRFDLTRLHKHSLSAETLSYLTQLNQPVLILVTFTPNAETADEEKFAQASQDLAPLLQQYVYATEASRSGKVAVQHLDVYQRPREAQQLGAEQNQILVLCGNRSRIIRYEDLYQFTDGKRTAFLGEQAITTAILDVANNNRKKIYFLAAHGELDPSDVSPDRGISAFRDQLSNRNFELDRLDLREKRRIPDDAALVVSVRPTASYEPFEQELLRQYLSTRAGRMLVLLGPGYSDLGLSDLFFDWGILADKAVIYDSGRDGLNDVGGLILKNYAPHPVTQPIIDQKLPVRFGACRSIRVNPSRASDESLIVTRLIGTSDTAWGERNPLQNPPRFDPTVDIIGRVLGVGVASERVGAKAELNFSVPRGRLLVFGCADFITNNRISAGGNLTIALSSINWLVDRDTQLNVAAKPIEKFQLALSQQELLRLRYSLLFALPAAFALLGLIVYWTRRR
jgi:hypothetical protein